MTGGKIQVMWFTESFSSGRFLLYGASFIWEEFTPVQVLLNASKVLEWGKKKQEVENDLLFIMAP